MDFTYEVCVRLPRVRGDPCVMTQGIEVRPWPPIPGTITTRDSTVVNKIDLPNAEPERVRDEVVELLVDPEEVIFASAKTGVGVRDAGGSC